MGPKSSGIAGAWFISNLCPRGSFISPASFPCTEGRGSFPTVWECAAPRRSCRRHFHTIIAARRRRNGCEVPHMPLFGCAHFSLPHRSSTVSAMWHTKCWLERVTEPKWSSMMRIQIIRERESLPQYCFARQQRRRCDVAGVTRWNCEQIVWLKKKKSTNKQLKQRRVSHAHVSCHSQTDEQEALWELITFICQ